ncbi:hypothetical protein Y032_0899g2938 [Ancylostoma ceylanicum]|uniref:Protein-tyrosine phosphatase n=1 Tax=Ancylostoma ceylanicum TaxID=53326 RepID=A0A016WBL8_9BILA|nr:hypothetical protein Y032_0899g2938 [Ancylostoma ceylanicum]
MQLNKKEKKEKDRGTEVSERRKKVKEEKEKGSEVSERRRKVKEEKERGAEVSERRRKVREEKEKGPEVSERRRRVKEEKEKNPDVSERRKRNKEEKERGSDVSERKKRTKGEKDKGSDVSERKKRTKGEKDKDTLSERRKRCANKCDVSERKKKDKKKAETASERKELVKPQQENEKKTASAEKVADVSERRKKKQSTLKFRMKKFVSALQKQDFREQKTKEVGSVEKNAKEKIKPTEAQKTAFDAFVKGVFENGVEGLIREYAILKPYLAASYSREVFDQNTTKNRYKDVICNDHTRVILKDGKGSDYIHANYVKGNNLLNTFICTQGPMLNTIEDFWRMVVCEHVAHIVMLCDTVEMGKSKCEQYWPLSQDQKMEVGGMTLTTVKVNANDNHVTRSTIEVQVGNGGPHFIVKHHRWRTWPDKTVPKSLLAVFRILQVVRSTPNPIIVHCSAGIGRTGSMVAIEMALQTLLAGEKLNLLETCRKLRGWGFCSVIIVHPYTLLFKESSSILQDAGPPCQVVVERQDTGPRWPTSLHISHQRMHSVQVEVQYVYVAEALCEYGKAMGYWSNPDLLMVSS